MIRKKRLFLTETGEQYQPARIYYQVFDRDALAQLFVDLECIDFDRNEYRGWLLYAAEAQSLKFKKTHQTIAKLPNPLTLAQIHFSNEQQMLLDVQSVDRAIAIIGFFDKCINRDYAKAVRLRLVNRCFDITDLPNQLPHESLDIFFDREDIQPPKAEEILATIESIKSEHSDGDRQRDLISNYIAGLEKQPAPEIEELPINLYEDGDLTSTKFALKMREKTAYEQWRGNRDFNPIDNLFKRL